MPLTLTKHIGELDKETIESPNLCDRFGKDDLGRIGEWCWDGYQRDKRSRSKWEKRIDAAMDLAMQIQKAKNFPWPNCSNVAFPLITLGAWEFHSKAYPALVNGPDIVQYRVVGQDPAGLDEQRALDVGAYMSWQVLEEDQSWEEQHDRMLIHLPVIGTAFKKTRWDGSESYVKGDFVMARDLVVNYWAKSLKTAKRKTHVFPLDRNDIWERIEAGSFRDIRKEDWYNAAPPVRTTTQQTETDNRTGQEAPTQPDELTPFQFGEQHVLCDLDGDGYAEPYIITFELNNHCVVRIVTGFDRIEDIDRSSSGMIRSIRRRECFVQYVFLPSPDGGLYGIGFGVLLGPMNESVNSLINQLIDAGTMANAAGGFLAKGAKLRGGNVNVSPFGWTRVEATGDDIRKSMVEYPVRQPSTVLFQLLTLLIEYTQKIAGTTEMQVGETPGQNTPAETARTAAEMGQRIYAAIFKRIWRSMKEEFSQRYQLNGTYIPITGIPFGAAGKAKREDYLGDPTRICPVADPNVMSDTIRMQNAMALKQFAQTTPGYNWEAVERRVLRAMKVDAVDQVYVGPKSPKATAIPNPKAAVEQIKLQGKQMELQMQQQQFTLTLMEDRKLNTAKIIELQAKAASELAAAGGVQAGHQIAAFEAAIGALKAHDESLRGRIELMMKSMENQNGPAGQGGMGSVANPPSDSNAAAMGAGGAGGLSQQMGAGAV